jgi:cobalamin biosynthesis Mg chelatase CobN
MGWLGTIAAAVGLLIAMNGVPVLAGPPDLLKINTPVPADDPEADAVAEAGVMATTVAILHWQGEQGNENLARVVDVAVPNHIPAQAATFDIAAEKTATANAAATATAVAATAVANSVQATVSAQATSAALEAAALSATQEANAQAAATEAARATQTAQAKATTTAGASATAVAASVAATMSAEAAAVAAVPTAREISLPVPPLLALVPLLAAISGVILWRARREPFVLKANPVSV